MWLHVLSDVLISLAYFTIPFVLALFIRKRRDLPFSWIFALFGVFIIACGATHIMEIWNLWHAEYWVAGVIKGITAVASVGTAILLARLLPQALALPSAGQWQVTKKRLENEISERKKIEENTELQRKELARKNLQLIVANKELESFSYSVSHDLRTPLRAIDGFSHALLEDCAGQLGEEANDQLRRIRAAALRMGHLIDDLLSLARLSRASMHFQRLDLSAIVTSVADGLSKAQPGREVDLHIALGLKATADSGLLRIVLENLLGNAWKFTSKKSSARIEFGQTDCKGTSTFFVRDDGAGFDPAYADRLFGPFQRLHGMTEFEGTGIGLATVQRIIHRHNGQIWAESAVDHGATFYFTLDDPTPERAQI